MAAKEGLYKTWRGKTDIDKLKFLAQYTYGCKEAGDGMHTSEHPPLKGVGKFKSKLKN